METRAFGAGRLRQAGLAWNEFSVVAVLLALLAGSLLTALFYYEELAEAAVVQLTVRNIRAGLRYQIADRLVQGRTSENPQLLAQNPVAWLESPPAGYVGNVHSIDVDKLPGGSWFYDPDRRELGYVPRHSLYLTLESGGPAILRWRVEALRVSAPWEAEGLTVVSVNPYRWF